jgi:hypothetical protein
MIRSRLCLAVAVVLSLGHAMGQAATEGGAQPMTAAEAARVDGAVRTFMGLVAHDVTHDGPLAWRKHFADSPAFFMINDGQMAFADSAAATKGIHDFAPTMKRIRLEWGSDLRVDPLTPNFAVVAASFVEDQEPLSGTPVHERGYFTGVAELHNGRWQIRDAHWSSLREQ